jgi:hypothetical protein
VTFYLSPSKHLISKKLTTSCSAFLFFTYDHNVLFSWEQVEAASKYSTVDSLKQEFYFVPADYKVGLSGPHLVLLLLLMSCCINDFLEFM